MFKELIEAMFDALRFRDITPDSISRVEEMVGYIWFKANGESYCIEIKKVSFDLDEYADSQHQAVK